MTNVHFPDFQRESSSSLTKRLTEMTEELRKAEAQKRSMGTELEKSQEGMRTVSEELNQARQQLQGLSKSDDEKKTMMAKFEEKEKVMKIKVVEILLQIV